MSLFARRVIVSHKFTAHPGDLDQRLTCKHDEQCPSLTASEVTPSSILELSPGEWTLNSSLHSDHETESSYTVGLSLSCISTDWRSVAVCCGCILDAGGLSQRWGADHPGRGSHHKCCGPRTACGPDSSSGWWKMAACHWHWPRPLPGYREVCQPYIKTTKNTTHGSIILHYFTCHKDKLEDQSLLNTPSLITTWYLPELVFGHPREPEETCRQILNSHWTITWTVAQMSNTSIQSCRRRSSESASFHVENNQSTSEIFFAGQAFNQFHLSGCSETQRTY